MAARPARGSLRKIAPKRFNPTGEAWLPFFMRGAATAVYGSLLEYATSAGSWQNARRRVDAVHIKLMRYFTILS
jgi:hypothetical protein